MPIWHHIKSKATRCLFNGGNRVKCLKNRHRVRTVGDLEKLASHLEEDRHTQCGRCSCMACLYARNELSCASPHKCFLKAKQLLDSLPPKWNPSTPLPSEIIIPMEDEEEDEQGGHASFFQPCLVTRGSLSDAFRIFIDSDECMEVYLHPELEETQPRNKVVVYTDGSAMNNGSDEGMAGAGVFYQNGDARNKSIQLPNEVAQTNQASKIVGAKTAAEDNPKEVEMDLVSDSRHVLDGLDRCFITWENEGYFRIANSTITQVMVTRFRARSVATRLMWVKGHLGNLGNKGANKLAGLVSVREETDIVDLTIPPELRTRRAKLEAMTQAKVYEIIRKIYHEKDVYQNKLHRWDTNHNLSLALAAAGERCGTDITTEELWRSIRRCDFGRPASPKPQPEVLVQVDVIRAVSQDHYDQVSQSEVDADQDYSHQVMPDLPLFCLV